MNQSSEPAVRCARHAQIPATQYCAKCAMPVCDNCAQPQSDGTFKCPTCHPPALHPQAPRPRIPGGVPMNQPCALHPEVLTPRRCAGCGAHICATCDFSMPGNLHICPNCAMNAPTGLSSSRKKLVVASILLAIWATAGFALTFVGALASVDPKVSGLVELLLILAPSIVGFGLGCSAQESRLHNPVSVWIGIIWNALIMFGYLFLVVWVLLAGLG